MIAPGATIGILGGGQLARMMVLAAAPLGYRCHIYAPNAELVASDVAAFTRASYDDMAALARFAAEVDVVTYEFENVPAAAVAVLEALKPAMPGHAALEVAQDRLCEKDFVAALGGRTAPYRAVDSLEELQLALADIGTPAILKTRRLGYDGKGQARINAAEQAAAAFASLGGAGLILEGFVSFGCEFSIIVARGQTGEMVCYPPCQNSHVDGILSLTEVPARDLTEATVGKATRMAMAIADALEYVGVLACEFFAHADGPVFNEMAPRVHNSGHWTIEGAVTSQFEQHIRAVCGLPLGPTGLRAARIEMHNLLGAERDGWPEILAEPGAHLHLYGKTAASPGRKMGHVTRLFCDG